MRGPPPGAGQGCDSRLISPVSPGWPKAGPYRLPFTGWAVFFRLCFLNGGWFGVHLIKLLILFVLIRFCIGIIQLAASQ
jgi:hypothetical protein